MEIKELNIHITNAYYVFGVAIFIISSFFTFCFVVQRLMLWSWWKMLQNVLFADVSKIKYVHVNKDLERPKHIGFIMDGNRRYGEKFCGNKLLGHEKGAKTFEILVKWGLVQKLDKITVYAWSNENWKRSEEEQNKLFSIAETVFEELRKHSEKPKVKFKIVFTSKEGFPKNILEMAEELEQKTENVKGLEVNVLFGYGGRQEIVLATKEIAKQIQENKLNVEDIDEKLFEDQLQVKTLDCVVRTSGERRLSGFLPWQSTYAELIFVDKFWPEMTEEDFDHVLVEYSRRKRRYGK